MKSFDEHSKKGRGIINWIEMSMSYTELKFKVRFKAPKHDTARRFLNEIVEFEPLEEG